MHLDEFTSLLNAKPAKLVDLRAEAKQLERINVSALLEQYKGHLLVSAEYGTGKTYSLKPIAEQALYVAHRKALTEPKAREYAISVCINSLHTVRELEGIRYVVLDEVEGILEALLWEKVPYELVINKLRELVKAGIRFIALDRDASKDTSKLLSELIGEDFAFHQHSTDSRQKHVVIANSLDGLYATAMEAEEGVRVVLCNTAVQAEELAQVLQPSFLVTSNNSFEAEKQIQQARAHALANGSSWLIASPAIQEGVSIDSLSFTFIGYVQSAFRDMARPTSKGMQALHRVRSPKAIRCVCLMEQSDLELAENESIADEAVRLEKQRELLSYILGKSYGAKYVPDPYKELGHAISRHRRILTFEQRVCLHDAWCKDLTKSGYDIIYAEDLGLELPLPEAELVMPDTPAEFCFVRQITDANVRWLRANSTLELRFDAEEPDSMRSRAYLARHFGADFANNTETVLAFKAEQYSYYKKLKDLKLLLYPELTLKLVCFKREAIQYKLFALKEILQDVVGAEAFSKLGTGEFETVVGRYDFQEHKRFAEYKSLLKRESQSNKIWFKRILESFGISYIRCGKGYKKLKLTSKLWVNI